MHKPGDIGTKVLDAERHEVIELLGADDGARGWRDLDAEGRARVDQLVCFMRREARAWTETIGERVAKSNARKAGG
jgi:hypothetical protein